MVSNGNTEKKAAGAGPNQLAAAFGRQLSLASRSVHADDYTNTHTAVAPPMHVSTTFRYPRNPDELVAWSDVEPEKWDDFYIYSREKSPNTTRYEAILSSILGGPAVSYASGLAAFHAMVVFLNPKRVAIGGGYHGCHGILKLMNKLNGLEQLELESEDDLAKLQKGDIIHVETPLNPTGEARDLAYYRKKADELGCYLTVDATFAPPPLQDPFKYGVDIVMHSGTKYFGGHSDMLSGVLAIHPDRAGGKDGKPGWLTEIREERLHLGGVMGSFEGWLGTRSLRTLELRVKRQSETTRNLVDWLASQKKAGGNVVADLVYKLQHSSQQPEASDPDSWLSKQMPNGHGPVFSLWLQSEELAKRLPSKLFLFHHATSLGGIESLVEWRAMSDTTVDRRLVRVSIGVESWEDLRDDLLQGFEALHKELNN
ncbi:Cys/Met metabolism PLP-dependent enzyme-domain-containing protein [Chaetomium tenue]|uniref:Cys/Met metabolism PLP-dependent enzyme-domain-containing protein n=1 Tax=Chaetomium tenue TaxID=1854479 RepID=A0ACB7P508_9PEZI|nr:Cys/Met metabolism PLP-dependent enzyme-domain-containing protein [Chaetomium globosum]